MQKEFVLKSNITGNEYSFTAIVEGSSPDGRQFIKTIQSGITGSLYVQRLDVQRRYFQLQVLFHVKDMSSWPVSSGIPQRGGFQDLMDLIEEASVEMRDWEDNRYPNAILLTADASAQVLSPATYPRTVPLEIIVP